MPRSPDAGVRQAYVRPISDWPTRATCARWPRCRTGRFDGEAIGPRRRGGGARHERAAPRAEDEMLGPVRISLARGHRSWLRARVRWSASIPTSAWSGQSAIGGKNYRFINRVVVSTSVVTSRSWTPRRPSARTPPYTIPFRATRARPPQDHFFDTHAPASRDGEVKPS